MGGLYSDGYDAIVDPAHARCRCDDVTTSQKHCLNSKEAWNIAEFEGLLRALLTNCSTVTAPPQAKDGYGALNHPDLKWNWTKCTNMPPSAVEYDWMRFYYKVGARDSGSGDPATITTTSNLFDIYKLACGNGTPATCTSGNSANLNGSSLLIAARAYYDGQFDPRYTRFADWFAYEGVQY